MKSLNLLLLSTLTLFFTPAHPMGLWSKFAGMFARNNGKIATVAATCTMGSTTAYATKHQDELRLAAVESSYFGAFNKLFPWTTHKVVVGPLLKRCSYEKLSDFTEESDEATKQRQKILKALQAAEVLFTGTQTEADLLSYHSPKEQRELLTNTYRGYQQLNTPEARGILNAMFAVEKSENTQGNFVLYHAMPHDAYAANYIGTALYSVVHRNLPSSFLFLRQRSETSFREAETKRLYTFDSCTPEFDIHFHDTYQRKKFLEMQGFDGERDAHGALSFTTDHAPEVSQYLLSCGNSIANNTEQTGECPLLYWRVPRSSRTIHYETHNIPAGILKKYKERLQKAKDLLQENPAGVMLQISLSPELIDKVAYPAWPFGFKKNLYEKSTDSLIQKASDIMWRSKQLPSTVRVGKKDPETQKYYDARGINHIQWRLIADKSLLLDPTHPDVRTSFKVKAYAGKPEVLEKFHQEIDAIVDEMRAEMQGEKAS